MRIDRTSFGQIIIDGEKYHFDVVIYPDRIIERKKWISKEKHGTSHKFTRDEMFEYLKEVESKYIDFLVVGTGQYGKLSLMEETKELLKENEIKFLELKTPESIKVFNESEVPVGKKMGIFHLTC